mgnify:CR=1 FL=1
MKKILPFLWLWLLLPAFAFAQDSTQWPAGKAIGFKLSGTHSILRDDVIFPVNYYGYGGTLGGFYQRTSAKTYQELALDLHFSSMKDFLGFEAIYTYPDLRYAYTWRFTSDSNKSVRAFAGPMVEAQYNMYYFLQTDDSHLQWLTQYNIGAKGVFDIAVTPRKSARIYIDIPLLRLCSRPPREVYYSNFNPAFGKIMNMIHKDAQFNLGAGGFRLGAFYPLRETAKSVMHAGYEHFIINYNHTSIMSNALTIRYGFKK